MRNRTHRIEVYLSDQELNSLNSNIKKTGLSYSSYIRKLIANRTPRELPPADFHSILDELRIINARLSSRSTCDMDSCYRDIQSVLGTLKDSVYTESR